MQFDDLDIVRTHYDEAPEMEWNRVHEQTIEYILTEHRLLRYIHSGDRVLDIGGGPGRYSLMLAKNGCDVTLIDLSPRSVDFAGKKAAEQGIRVKTVCGDARSETSYPAENFDHILIMGPMYHLAKDEDRQLVMKNVLNHLRPGGKVYIAFITLFAGIDYYLDCCLSGPLDKYLAEGMYVDCVANNCSWIGQAFTNARFDSLDDMHAFCDGLGLQKICFFGQEGILGSRIHQVEALAEPERSTWISLADRLCERPEYLNHSAHIIYIGQK